MGLLSRKESQLEGGGGVGATVHFNARENVL